MIKDLKPALLLFVLLTLLTGAAYPLLVTGISQVLFPGRANGSLIEGDGMILGSELIGQPFSDPRYFWGRPSATAPVPYNAGASSGSNLGPTNAALEEAVKARIAALQGGRPGQRRAHPGGSGHRLRQRPRPPHQPGGGRVPGGPRRPRARTRPECRAHADGAAHERPPTLGAG